MERGRVRASVRAWAGPPRSPLIAREPGLETAVDVRVDRQVRSEDLHVEFLEFARLLVERPLLIAEDRGGHQEYREGEPRAAAGARSADSPADTGDGVREAGLGRPGRLGQPRERLGTRLLQAIRGAGAQVCRPDIEITLYFLCK